MTNVIDVEKALQSLKEAVIKTFGEMLFIDVIPSDVQADNAWFDMIVSIDILKPITGKIIFLLPNILKKKIIRNIYTDDFDFIGEKEGDDCIMEIVNVLAGKFLTECFGNDVSYKFDFPTINFNYAENDESKVISMDMDAECIPLKVVLKSIEI